MLLQTQNVCSSVGCLDNLGEGICLVCLYILMLKFIPCNCSNSILLLLILFQVIKSFFWLLERENMQMREPYK